LAASFVKASKRQSNTTTHNTSKQVHNKTHDDPAQSQTNDNTNMASFAEEPKKDPYWAPPEAEAPRFNRIEAAIRGCDTIPGRPYGYKGIAHFGRNPDNIILIIAMSANDNAIIWEYTNEGAGGPKILVYWLNIEPGSREVHLGKGNESLINKLNAMEEVLCGAQVEIVSTAPGTPKRYIVNIRAEQLAKRKMELMLDADGTPFLGGALNGKSARIESAYLQMRRGVTPAALLSPASIDDIRIYGTDVAVNTSTYGQRVLESLRTSLAGQ
jgi:hypothetical protein